MDEFVNYSKRGIELPPRCFDLIDVLAPPQEVRIPTEGFIHIECYLSRLLQSPLKRHSVTIWSLDYKENIRISSKDGALRLMVTVDTANVDREQAVLRFFSELGISSSCDVDGRKYDMPLRVLIFPLPASATDVAHSIRAFLQKVYCLADDAGLLFEYRERPVD